MIAVAALLAGPFGEYAGRFECDVDAEFAPRQFRRSALSQNQDLLSVDDESVACRLDRSGESAVDRVVSEELAKRFGIAQVVDGYDVEVLRPCRHCSKNEASDATESVDPYSHYHDSMLQSW